MNFNDCFKKVNNKGVVYFRSENITTPHGFSTRLGGVSTIPHLSSMNMGHNLKDNPESVRENYRLFGEAVGFLPDSVVYTNQIHSSIVKYVTPDDCGKTYECDGFVSNCKGVTLSVRTADCVPILFYDDKNGVIGAAHAGWRGTVGNIAVNTVKHMEKYGAHKENVKVAIGPSIHSCCYEVGEDFYLQVKEALGKELCDRFVVPFKDKWQADIVNLNAVLLIDYGLKTENISISKECTCCKPDLFFSHRASGGKRGVMSSIIRL